MLEMNELYKKLKADLPDEIKGVKMYAELSKMAQEHNADCWAAMLKDMAWDENVHAKHIMHMLDKGGVMYEELLPMYIEAHEMLKNL